MTRYYLVPLIRVAGPMGLMRVPKYVWEMNPPWQGADYGMEDLMLVSADTDDAQHGTLTAYPDVWTVPDRVSDPIGASSLDALKARLEAVRLPAHWLTAAHRYGDVLRFILGVFMLAQRYHVRANRNLAQDGVVTALTWGQLPTVVRDGLATIVGDLKLNAAGITGSTTLREIMKGLADQFPRLVIRGVEL